MTITFPVISRFTGTSTTTSGEQLDPVTVTWQLGLCTRDKVITLAAEYGWQLEHGYERSVTQTDNDPGALNFISSADKTRVVLEFGAKGQITCCLIGDRTVHSHRYEAIHQALTAGREEV